MASLRPIPVPKCRCGEDATSELVNRRKSVVGYFCAACGALELERHLVFERRAEKNEAIAAYENEVSSGQ